MNYTDQKAYAELIIKSFAKSAEIEDIQEFLQDLAEDFNQYDLEDIRSMIGRARIIVQIPLEGL